MKNEYKELLEQFRRYSETQESRAILFVKRHLKQANDKYWVNILKSRELDRYPALKPGADGKKDEGPFFGFVRCELYPRRTKPDYPPRRKYQSDGAYVTICRALTWEAAHDDIEHLSMRGYKGPIYEIFAELKPIKGAGLFVPDAPPEIQALAKNPNDRTDPLWDEAVRYLAATEKFRIRGIRRAR